MTKTEGQCQRNLKGSQANASKWPLEAGKSKKINSPLELPEGMLFS